MASSTNIEQFKKDIDAAFDKKVVQKFLQFHRAVALDAFKKVSTDTRDVGIAYGSPVWSGSFRHGHNISLDTPDLTPPEKHPDVADGSLRWPDEPDEVMRAKSLAEASMKLMPLRPFSQVFIANAAPYARKLEGGYSRLKAPEGVYKITAMEVIGKFKAASNSLAKEIGK